MPILGANSSGGSRPSAPTIGAASDGGTGTTASVAFTPSTYIGKGTITYTATSSPGNLTGTASSSPITVSGLTTGTAYTFTVQGTTNYGVTSSASSSSNSVTPITPTAFNSIASVDPTGQTSVTFSGISSSYKSLQIRVLSRNTNAQSGDTILLTFNSDTNSNYTRHSLYNYGSGNLANGSDGTSYIIAGYTAYGGLPSNQFGGLIIDIVDYSSASKYKTVRSYGGRSSSSADQSYTGVYSGHWKSTNAVNSVTISFNANTFASGSFISLYGVS